MIYGFWEQNGTAMFGCEVQTWLNGDELIWTTISLLRVGGLLRQTNDYQRLNFGAVVGQLWLS